ncbi:uncharacterized protein LOC132976036 [Labrus mixtus]|uniref:uncharacterized protein LOC132976036 n=1 Tax=Labrus mixtus TaxID=508554 RepID=UPI0029C09C13|nr:uncharacterized protein LOC132976036 [Labrus mixtus]
MKDWWEQQMHLHNYLNEMGVVLSRVNNSCRAASREPVITSQTVSSVCDKELNRTNSDHSSIKLIQNKACEKEELQLIPSLPESACIERGYITPLQVYNLLNAEDGQPAQYDPYYMLILDCCSPERYKDSHMVTARAAVTVIHPELGCLISCVELHKYSIILLYAEEGCSPGRQSTFKLLSISVLAFYQSISVSHYIEFFCLFFILVGSMNANPDLQRCFFQLSGLGMDPVILLGGFSAFYTLYPFLCTPHMVLLEPERHTLTIYPSEIPLPGICLPGL